jgi:hypothetical protein
VLVAGWVGSTNLGDELVLAGLLRHLRDLGAQPVVLSVDPDATARDHGVEAVRSGGPAALVAAAGGCDALVLGGGGLLQDETSPFNLPFHLARAWAAALRRLPRAGVGLGAGRLDTALGRRLVRASLRGMPVSVRDPGSADLLAALGLPRPVVAADLALALPDVDVAPADRVVVCLRPWAGGGGLLPASVRARLAPPQDAGALAATAGALDELHARTGLVPHLVALQADRDGPLHDAVADRMTAPVTTARPGLAALPAEVASGPGGGGDALPRCAVRRAGRPARRAGRLLAQGRRAGRRARPRRPAAALARRRARGGRRRRGAGPARQQRGARTRLRAREPGNVEVLRGLMSRVAGPMS